MLFDLFFKTRKPVEDDLPQAGGGCGSGSCGCKKKEEPAPAEPDGYDMKLGKTMNRRAAFRQLTAGLL